MVLFELIAYFPWLDLCGDLASMSGIGLSLSPLPTVRGFTVSQCVGELPLLPYTAMVMNSFLWGFYGLLRSEPRVFVANVVPFALAIYYVAQYVRFNKKGKSSLKQHGTIIASVIIVCISTVQLFPVDKAAELVGTIADVASVLMYGGPLASMKHVIETKSADSIPLPYLAGVTACSLMWFLYGLFGLHDLRIVIPNSLGLLASTVQFGLIVKYGRSKKIPPLVVEELEKIEEAIDATVIKADTADEITHDVELSKCLSRSDVASSYGSTLTSQSRPFEETKASEETLVRIPIEVKTDCSFQEPVDEAKEFFYRYGYGCREEARGDYSIPHYFSELVVQSSFDSLAAKESHFSPSTEMSPLLPNTGECVGETPALIVV